MNSFIAIELNAVLYEWVQTHPITGKPHLDQKLVTIAITLITGYATIMLAGFSGFFGKTFRFLNRKIIGEPKVKTVEQLDEKDKEDKYSIILTKRFGEEDKDKKLDSLMDHISELYHIKSLGYQNMMYLLNFYDYFQLTKDIRCRLIKIEYNEAQKLSLIKIIVSSNVQNVQELRQFVESTQEEYTRKIQNKLGNKTYFFDLIPGPKKKDPRVYRGNNSIPFVSFTKNIFMTTRSFDNVYFEQKDVVQRRTEFFVNRADWYQKKGMPYTLGFMFYGPPGCGKTSTIKAIANYTGRHIINISLDEVKTKTQLKNLFFNDDIITKDRNQPSMGPEIFKIPINKRLYVIEDIDCMSDIVYDRQDREEKKENIDIFETEPEKQSKWPSNDISKDTLRLGAYHHEIFQNQPINKMNSDTFATKPIPATDGMLQKSSVHTAIGFNKGGGTPIQKSSTVIVGKSDDTVDDEDDKITLSSLLNILDGTLEVPGRIIIITTNYPEKLDKALIRPGRIDMHVHFKKFSRAMAKEMIEGFYDIDLSIDDLSGYDDYKYTPAEIHAILFRNMESSENAIKELCCTSSQISL